MDVRALLTVSTALGGRTTPVAWKDMETAVGIRVLYSHVLTDPC
jgi:hypothetical protein